MTSHERWFSLIINIGDKVLGVPAVMEATTGNQVQISIAPNDDTRTTMPRKS